MLCQEQSTREPRPTVRCGIWIKFPLLIFLTYSPLANIFNTCKIADAEGWLCLKGRDIAAMAVHVMRPQLNLSPLILLTRGLPHDELVPTV